MLEGTIESYPFNLILYKMEQGGYVCQMHKSDKNFLMFFTSLLLLLLGIVGLCKIVKLVPSGETS